MRLREFLYSLNGCVERRASWHTQTKALNAHEPRFRASARTAKLAVYTSTRRLALSTSNSDKKASKASELTTNTVCSLARTSACWASQPVASIFGIRVESCLRNLTYGTSWNSASGSLPSLRVIFSGLKTTGHRDASIAFQTDRSRPDPLALDPLAPPS